MTPSRRCASTLLRACATVVLLGAGTLCGALAAVASGNVLLDQTNIIGLPTVAAPVQFSFSVAGASVVTVTDLAEPAAFVQLEAVLVSNDALVGTPQTVSATTHTASLNITAAGNYTLYLAGLPSSSQGGFGSYQVCVGLEATPSTCTAQTSGTLATPSAPSSSDTSTLSTSFTSTVTGTYTITLSDDAFPAALQMASAGVSQGATPIVGPVSPGTPTQFQAQADTTYQLLIGAVASSTTNAGLYGVQISDPTGKLVFNQSFPVGELGGATIVDNPAAQSLTLALTDYQYPQALTNLAAAVTQGGTLLGSLPAAGSQTQFNAAAGSTDVWTFAVASAQPGVYNLSLSSSSASILSQTEVVNPSNASNPGSYAFLVTLPSAGTYTLAVTDFQFPGALQSPPSATIAQNGAELTVTNGQFTAAAGVAIIVVAAQPPASGGGIFDVTVTDSAGTKLLDQTQAVGGEFTTQTINLGTSGAFTATLTDLGFPQDFSNLALVVSSGGQVLGKIYGGGSFNFTGTAGATYLVTFIATPSSESTNAQGSAVVPGYGLYTINIASAAPTVTLSSSATTVSEGGTVTLTWSSQNATSCTASGGTGWTGSESTSGSLAVSVASTETLTLSCTGPGGSATDSVKITATAASTGGGGGSLGSLEVLALFAAVGSIRLRRATCARQRSARAG